MHICLNKPVFLKNNLPISAATLTREKKCFACDQTFGCGFTQNNGICWCNDFPPIFQPDPVIDCMCPVCLKKAMIERISTYVAGITPDLALQNKAKELPRTSTLLEDIDYYLENGNYVFTAWYHLKRGSCCGNGCRHCPYRTKNGE